MNVRVQHVVAAAALLAALTPATAQQSKASLTKSTKADVEKRLDTLRAEIKQLRAKGAQRAQLAPLQKEYKALQANQRHGKSNAHAAQAPTATSTSGAQHLAPPTCGSAPLLTGNFAGTTGPIAPPIGSFATFTTTVSGIGTVLWDLNLNTSITHTFCSDLAFELTSPAGTTVTVSTNNGEFFIDVFNGTVWDDNVNDPATDYLAYADFVTATPLSPEGRFSAFRGEDPNGVWTLTVKDQAAIDTGSVNAWSLDITTVGALPATTTTTVSKSPGLAISPTGTPTVVDTQSASGMPTSITDVKLYVECPHTFCADLTFVLTSPGGTAVTLSSNNGDFFTDCFNGTTFDAFAAETATDHGYGDFVVATPLSPEGSVDNFLGQNPNGTWTLTVLDGANLDGGTLVRWDVIVTATNTPAVPSAPSNFAGTTGPIPDYVTPTPVPSIFTTNVTGMGISLWDVDVNTAITDTFNSDLDITLTSPAGTTVVLSTNNGFDLDDVFNGSVWDDNVNDPATLYLYTNGVAATPISPEGRLAAFRGEDPNGTWTLTVVDEFELDNGTVNGWSLDLATLNSAPGATTTNVTQSPGIAISPLAPNTISDAMLVSGLDPYMSGLTVFVQVTHTWTSDLTLTLTSPAGTIIPLSVNWGQDLDDVFNGTLFDPDATTPVSDYPFVDLVAATAVSPEGSFDNFVGQDPNGTWTLTIDDAFTQDGGTLVRWDLNITTCVGAGNSFCSNDTLGIDHATGCPCGNTGAAGNGCAHSFSAAGANLVATGSAAADTVQLHSTNEPATSFTLFLQHATGGDTVFHDGVLCAGGTLIRLRGRAAVAGEAFFPNPAFPVQDSQTLSQRGGTFPGSGATRRYSAWFRNASTTFCPPATANISNGWVITW